MATTGTFKPRPMASSIARTGTPSSATVVECPHEDRHLQRQQHRRTAARPAPLARVLEARRRLPAGVEGARREVPGRGLPGDPDDTHSRYLEAVVGGITVGCLYLPNGNPAPRPRFDYKLKWFERP